MAEGILEQISENLQNGKADQVKELVNQALDQEEYGSQQVLNEGLVAGMSVIGEKFKQNEVYVPGVLIAARAMNAGMEIVKPRLQAEGVEPKGTAVVGTVKGDLHDIGKNLVCMMLEGGGYEVVDLGVNVEPDSFVQTAEEKNASIIGLSALLTTTMGEMKNTVQAVQDKGLSGQVNVLIGGAPVTQNFADEIGADGYAADAASAVDVANSLVG